MVQQTEACIYTLLCEKNFSWWLNFLMWSCLSFKVLMYRVSIVETWKSEVDAGGGIFYVGVVQSVDNAVLTINQSLPTYIMQIKAFSLAQFSSFHPILPELFQKSTQCSSSPSSGWPGSQTSVGMLRVSLDIQVKAPSVTWSFSPIQTRSPSLWMEISEVFHISRSKSLVLESRMEARCPWFLLVKNPRQCFSASCHDFLWPKKR